MSDGGSDLAKAGDTDPASGPDDPTKLLSTDPTSRPHRYANEADGPVRFVMVVLQFGDTGLVPPTAIAPVDLSE